MSRDVPRLVATSSVKLLSSSKWRTLRLVVEEPYWNDEAGVGKGDAVNEDGVAQSGSGSNAIGEFAVDCTMC